MNRLEKYKKEVKRLQVEVYTSRKSLDKIPDLERIPKDVLAIRELLTLFANQEKVAGVKIKCEINVTETLKEGRYIDSYIYPTQLLVKIAVHPGLFINSGLSSSQEVLKWFKEASEEHVRNAFIHNLSRFKAELKHAYEFWNTEL